MRRTNVARVDRVDGKPCIDPTHYENRTGPLDSTVREDFQVFVVATWTLEIKLR